MRFVEGEGLGEFGGAVGPLGARPWGAVHGHVRFPLRWLEGADEDGVGLPLFTCDDVEQPVDSIGEVDVAVPSTAEHNGRARGRPSPVAAPVASQIRLGRITIRLGFHNAPRQPHPLPLMNQRLAQ